MIKKYFPYILIVILLICLVGQQYCINGKIADALGEKAKREAVEKNNKKLNTLLNGYRLANLRLYGELAKSNAELKNTGVKADGFAKESEKQRKKILELSDYKSQAIQLNLRLVAANDFILTLSAEYTTNIDLLNDKWGKIVASKDKEIIDLTALYGALNTEYGDLVKKHTIVALRGKQRVSMGFFVGIGVDGKPTAGVGLTFNLIKIPVSIF